LYRSVGAESSVLALLLNLAELTWALGDLDAALARFREAAALMQDAPLRDMLGFCLTNLAGVLIERGEFDEALVAARKGLPLRMEAGEAWGALAHLALRAALVGQVANAARIVGHTDFVVAAKQAPRQPNEARSRNRVQKLLQEKFSTEELDRLLAEGAKLSEEDACRLALEGKLPGGRSESTRLGDGR